MNETKPLLEDSNTDPVKRLKYTVSYINDGSSESRKPEKRKDNDIAETKKTTNAKLTFCFLMLIWSLQTYGLMLYTLVLTQYGYAYIQRQLFPNAASLNATDSDLYCTTNKSTDSFKEHTTVQQRTSKWLIFISLAEKIPCVCVNSVIGALSDRYGRKNMLIYTFTGEFLKTFGYFMLMYFDLDINYFIPVTLIEGISGGFFGGLSVSFALVADLTTSHKERTLMITLLELFLGIGAIISSFVSGYLIDYIGYAYSMAIASGVLGICLFLICICLKETNCRITNQRVSLVTNITNVIKFYTQDTSSTAKRWKFILCILTFTAVCFGFLSKSTINPLYQMNVPFCWTSVKIGWYSSVSVLGTNFIGIFSVKFFQVFTKASEAVIGILSTTSNAMSCVLAALSYNDLMLFLVTAVGVLSELSLPMIRAIMSKMTPKDKQGAVFASIAFVETLSSLVGEITSRSIYMTTVAIYRGTTYFVFCGYNVIAIILFTIFVVSSRDERKASKTLTLT